eukprot:TRINITY_DN3105_c0_g1_i2.p1 TRINITY_DN3105_c0_g1~~TRINITY_DN3105_c0_g1_i2.p1  ORF type:complete len:467 (-),score=59.08 TRINITY_DN3105_c0_g1_i2:1084-2484(-)
MDPAEDKTHSSSSTQAKAQPTAKGNASSTKSPNKTADGGIASLVSDEVPIMGNLFGVMESTMTKFADHLSVQKQQMASIETKVEGLGKIVSNMSSATSTAPSQAASGAASEKQLKVLTDKLDKISTDVSKCMEASGVTKSSTESMEKSIAKISERLNALEQTLRSQTTKMADLATAQADSSAKISKQLDAVAEREPSSSSASVSSRIEALETGANQPDTTKQLNDNVKKCLSGLAELSSEIAALKVSRTTDPAPRSQKKTSGSLFFGIMVGLTVGLIFGAYLMNPDIHQIASRLQEIPHWVVTASDAVDFAKLLPATDSSASRPSKLYVLFEKNKEPPFISWLAGASSVQIEPLSREQLDGVKKGDIVLHTHRVVSQKVEGFWDRELFSAASEATGGSVVFVSLRSVDPSSTSPAVFPSGIASGVGLRSASGGDRIHLEFRHGLDDNYESEYNRAMLSRLEALLNK